MSQMYGLSSERCSRRCLFKSIVVLNFFSHSSHLYGCSEWWIRLIWLVSARSPENVFKHSVHLNASGWCCFLWLFNKTKCLNDSEQILHWCELLRMWIPMCSFKVWNFLNVFAQIRKSNKIQKQKRFATSYRAWALRNTTRQSSVRRLRNLVREGTEEFISSFELKLFV